MQSAAIRDLRIPYEYRAIRVKADKLKQFMKTQAKQLAGFNVTIPHKVAILGLLDRLAFEAKLIGAVNTAMFRDGEWIGFNTDGAGYLMSLQEDAGFNPRDRHVVLLGAGGAARAISIALGLHRAKSITIANRTEDRALALVSDLHKKLPKLTVEGVALHGAAFRDALKRCHLLVNCTAVGLKNSKFQDFPWEELAGDTLVSDIVYHPRFTPFLKTAKRAGHPIHSGEGMLVHQGALALEIWTGKKPDTGLMRRVLLKELRKRK